MNLLDRFNKNVIGSRGSIFDYAPVISASGDFKRVSDFETIILSWNNILMTPTRSYDHDPEYGCDLYKMIFDPADEITAEKIKNEITLKLTKYDDRAIPTDVKVNFLNNMKGFSVDIQIKYKGQTDQLQVTLDESIYFKFMETSS